jgi:uncharacterized Zn finger protein
MRDTFPCPKCGRTLERSGEVVWNDQPYPVFQCGDCVRTADIFGEPFEVCLTFLVDGAGTPFDPASPDGSFG